MNGIVKFALTRRILVLVVLFLVCVGGFFAFKRLNIEAYPDPVPPMVDIITQSSGQSAEEIERYITVPIEIQMAGIPNLTYVRTISLFGLSDVKVGFNYNFTYDQAEQWVINRLSQLSPLPNGAVPQISPESSVGEVYRYVVTGPPGYSVTDLKTLQDWVLQRRFKAVPGVIDVTGWGGKTKTYEVTVDQNKLTSYGLTIPKVLQSLGNSNINVGGQTVNFGPQAAVVRGIGLIQSAKSLGATMLSSNNGSPVFLRDVSKITVGNQPRLGIVGLDELDDTVEGIVLMRHGEKSMPTIKRIEAEVEEINKNNILPPGVRIDEIYDRKHLIDITTHTVLENMTLGILLIFVIQWLFLGNLRSAVVVAITIPFALAFAISLMALRGESANLLSVGAIDFGLVIDASVIMVENIFRHLSESSHERFANGIFMHRARVDWNLSGKNAVIANSATEVGRPIIFSALIIIAGFVPLFTLSGIEGHIFGPMATTYGYAITGGLIASFTISPALSAFLLRENSEDKETVLVRGIRRVYTPVVKFALGNIFLALSSLAVLVLLAGFAVKGLGFEFLPKLEEGNLYIRATLPPSVSLEEGNGYVNEMRKFMKSYPEVQSVVSQHGRPDDGTDSTGFFNAEFFVPLKPFDTWPAGMDKMKLTMQMTAELRDKFPGVTFNFSQNIEDNVEEAASGVKGENSVKLFGNDLDLLEQTAAKIEMVMKTVRGLEDLGIFNSLGQPTVKIDVDRERAARYGLATGDVNATVQSAIGGQSPGDLYEYGSDRHFPIVVRLAPKFRQSLDSIKRIPVGAPDPGGNGVVQIPLSDVADVRLVSGASFVYREHQERYIPIKFSVRGRDLGTTVLEAQKKVADQVRLPAGYRMEWVGEFGNFQEAMGRLAVIVPITILLICILLFINFHSFVDVLLAASVIPLAIIGGIFTLFLTGTEFSVSASIGFVALFGISTMEGILVISYFNSQIDFGSERKKAVLSACEVRLRPVLMTCSVACIGLLPAALSTGIGSQVQKPLAIVVVGGILLAPVLILIILPIFILMFSTRKSSIRDGEEHADA